MRISLIATLTTAAVFRLHDVLDVVPAPKRPPISKWTIFFVLLMIGLFVPGPAGCGAKTDPCEAAGECIAAPVTSDTYLQEDGDPAWSRACVTLANCATLLQQCDSIFQKDLEDLAKACANEISAYQTSVAKNHLETPSNSEVTDLQAGITYDYFAWYTYDLCNKEGRYVATVSTEELRYYRGHVHGVRPNEVQIATLRAALFAAVVQAATIHGVPYPGSEQVLKGAFLRTRSCRG